MHKQALTILRQVVPFLKDSNIGAKAGNNYKGVHGRIGIVGGARDYAGAPYFAAMSAMRLGADLAYVICSEKASQAIKNYSPDLIVVPLLDCSSDAEFATEMDCLLSRLHALVIGPGLGRDELLQRRARNLIEEAKKRSLPLILDADSLLLVNQDESIIKSYPKTLLTPNRIELQRLLNKLYAPEKFELRNMQTEDISELVKKCSSELGVSILAKGKNDIICDHKFELLTDDHSGSARRCGGQGDLIAGLAGVFIHWIQQANTASSQLDKIENPMAVAGYLAAITVRRCNELAYKEFGNGSLVSDMLGKVHLAIKSLIESDGNSAAENKQDSYKYASLFSKDELDRYARHINMEEFGPKRQLNLKKSSALIVGAGGLGCPAAVYLGAGGIGSLGIVDDDTVEASNLHRQILHSMDKVGMLKTKSIEKAVLAINPNVQIETHSVKLNRLNAVDLIEKYDMVLDCTDNLLTRYMLSDASVIAKRPLISGAALKMDGQLTVYNYDKETPCFRCLFPVPPPPNAVGSCSENGVLGVLPGIIGVQQAFEAIKLGAGLRPAYAGKMLLFDGQLGLFRHITLSKRNPKCEACGSDSNLDRNLIDYGKFCGAVQCQDKPKPNNILEPNERITVEQYRDVVKSNRAHVLVDVRPKEQSDISRFERALQFPVQMLLGESEECAKKLMEELRARKTKEIFVVCRLGYASQRGTRIIKELVGPDVAVKDIVGGMTAWAKHIDSENYSCV